MTSIVMDTTFTLDGFKTWALNILTVAVLIMAGFFAVAEFKKKSIGGVLGVIILGGFIAFFIKQPDMVLNAIGNVINLFFNGSTNTNP